MDSYVGSVKAFSGRDDMLKLRTDDRVDGIIIEWALREIVAASFTKS
jgi:hypothetical protein